MEVPRVNGITIAILVETTAVIVIQVVADAAARVHITSVPVIVRSIVIVIIPRGTFNN